MNKAIKAFTAIFAVFLGAVTMWGQLYSGSVTGVVTDTSGALIPRAQVTLTDQDKGTSFTAVSNAGGRYLFPTVPPAVYRISATAPGFQTQDKSNINIDVDQNASVNFSLPVGNTTEVVQVTGDAPLLSTEDASNGQVIGQAMIGALPLLNRDMMSLAYLTPGVVSPNEGSIQSGTYGNYFISNGGRAGDQDVLMDGVSTTNYEQNGSILVISYMPSPDAVQEFKIQTSNFSAEYGFSGSTIVNLITKSGTNSYHGSLYNYIRNQVVDANNWFNDAAGIPVAPQRWDNFGVSVGGPIRKNKDFFFADYDALRSASNQTFNFGVPSAAERTGDFGELCADNGGAFNAQGICINSNPLNQGAGQLWDPYSGTYNAGLGGPLRTAAIPYNNLSTYASPGNPNLNGTGYQLSGAPGDLIDPVASKLMQYFPAPNYNVGTAGYQYFNNYLGSGSNISNRDQADMKFDHTFNEQMRLSAKYSLQRIDNLGVECFHNVGDPCGAGPDTNHAYLFALNVTRSFTPSLLLSVSYGWNRWSERETGGMGDYPGVNPITALGLPAYMGVSGFPTIPNINLGNGYSSENGGSVGTWPWTIIVRGQDTHQLLGTMTWIKGSHEVKFGGEGRLHLINFRLPGPTGGYFFYGNNSTSQTPSTGGDAMASFMTGVSMNNSGDYEVPDALSTRNFQWGGFVLDNWKITRALTLNLGFRYDLTLPRTERHDKLNTLDPNVISPVTGFGTITGGEVFATSSNRSAYDPDYTNFQPRIGFSWEVFRNTVVRGGYGIFYGVSTVGATGQGGVGNQGWVEDTTQLTSQNNDGSTPWGRLSDPWPGTGPNLPPGNSLGLLNDVGFAAVGPIKTVNATPYSQSWSLGIQHEFRGNILVNVDYLATTGTHQYFGGDTNYNILPASVENYSANDVANNLTDYVPNPFVGSITNPNSSLSGSTIPAWQLQIPHPQFTTFGGDNRPIASSNYNALQAKVEKRFSRGYEVLVTYNFSKTIDDASSSNNTFLGGAESLQDPNKPYLERSVSLFDIPQQFQITHVIQLPFGHGMAFGNNWNPVVNIFLGGWTVNGTWQFLSGYPLQPTLANGVSLPTYGPQRPNLSGRPKRNTGSDWMTNYISNPGVFSAPASFALGTSPRTLPWVRTQGTDSANLSVSKSIDLTKLREGTKLEYRVDAFNALNHPQFGAPNMQVNGGAFGNVSSQANSPRQVQMALRVTF